MVLVPMIDENGELTMVSSRTLGVQQLRNELGRLGLDKKINGASPRSEGEAAPRNFFAWGRVHDVQI